jgi:uncharacterized protein (TIGR02266 family)
MSVYSGLASRDGTKDRRAHPPAGADRAQGRLQEAQQLLCRLHPEHQQGRHLHQDQEPLPVGTRFLFKLSIPGRDEPFELLGEVAWSNAEGDDAGMGIRFVYADDTQRFAFEDVVERLMSDSLGRELTLRLLNKVGGG